MPPTVLVASVEAHARDFASRFERLAASARMVRGQFMMALPGGSVAKAFLPALESARLDWSMVHVFWCDERAVPAESPESNFGLAKALLFDRAAAGARLHPMPAPEAADAYARELEMTLGIPPTLDLALLGVGEDGHVASLFPGHPALEEKTRSVLAVEDAPKPPARRLTMSLPMLLRAREVVVAAFGAAKSAAVNAALHDPASTSPLARVLQQAANVTTLLDVEAAGR